MPVTENETWILEEGDRVIEEKARIGFDKLTDWERLVYSLWIADYGMRNAGDLETSRDLFSEFQSVGRDAAEKLNLRHTREAFGLTSEALTEQYFDLFDVICAEIRSVNDGVA